MQARPFINIDISSLPKLPVLPRQHIISSLGKRCSSAPIHAPHGPKYKNNNNVIATRNFDALAFENYQSLFVSQRLETTEPIKLKLVDGSIPQDFPSGTYYLIGPGLFTDDYGSMNNPLDGHGYLRKFEITNRDGNGGEVRYSAKYVKTEAHKDEYDSVKGSWKFTYRGPFSVLKGGKMAGNMKVMKNVANTTVLKWSGRLFCLWEGGFPYEIDPGSLDTIGRFDMINELPDDLVVRDGKEQCMNRLAVTFNAWDVVAGLLKPVLSGLFKIPERRLLSHYKIDYQRKRLLAVSCKTEDMLIPRSHFTFYEFDAASFNIIQKQEFSIPDHLMIHDWGFTDSYYILLGNRVRIDVGGLVSAVCGLSPTISCLALNPSSKLTTPVYLLPRISSGINNSPVMKVDVPNSQLWLLHCANASEETDGLGNTLLRIHAATCSYQWFSFQHMFGYDWENGRFDPSAMNVRGQQELLPRLVQVSIKLQKNRNCNSKYSSVETVNKWLIRPSDFPIINPIYGGTKNRYVYSATSSGSCKELPFFPFDSIVKLDVSTGDVVTLWSSSSSTTQYGSSYVGEPIFVPKESPNGEDDGYLLVVEVD